MGDGEMGRCGEMERWRDGEMENGRFGEWERWRKGDLEKVLKYKFLTISLRKLVNL